MTWETLLTRLAALVGIEASYIDIYGRRIDTSLQCQGSDPGSARL